MTATTSWDVVERRTPRPLRAADRIERLVLANLDLPEGTDGGLCAQTDPEAFFPEKGGSTRDAKQVCRRCPVRGECLEYALTHDERFGIWGGLSERERRKLKRMRRAGWSIEATRGSDEDADALDLLSPQHRRVRLDAFFSTACSEGGSI